MTTDQEDRINAEAKAMLETLINEYAIQPAWIVLNPNLYEQEDDDSPVLNAQERKAIGADRWFSSLSPSLRHDILRLAFEGIAPKA